jgi:predicted porin
MFNTLDHISPGHAGMPDIEIEGRNAWIDANFDVERQWNKQLKTTVLYSYQRIDNSHGETAQYFDSHIFVGDVTYKFNKKHSMRVEAQYLASDDYYGDWVAATVEYNFAPMLSFYVSDMWNCEATDKNYNTSTDRNYLMHYYQVGATFTHSNYRVMLSYGRNRDGFVCSGGGCRYQPGFKGVNLAFTMSF